MRLDFTDDVRGIVVGEMTFPYQFWKDGRRLGRGHFASDAEAEAYCKEQFPEEYKTGIEMRAFDRPPGENSH